MPRFVPTQKTRHPSSKRFEPEEGGQDDNGVGDEEAARAQQQDKQSLLLVLTQWFDFFCPNGKQKLGQYVLDKRILEGGLLSKNENECRTKGNNDDEAGEPGKPWTLRVEYMGSGVDIIANQPVSPGNTVISLKESIAEVSPALTTKSQRLFFEHPDTQRFVELNRNEATLVSFQVQDRTTIMLTTMTAIQCMFKSDARSYIYSCSVNDSMQTCAQRFNLITDPASYSYFCGNRLLDPHKTFFENGIFESGEVVRVVRG